jgi:hypothetical protein
MWDRETTTVYIGNPMKLKIFILGYVCYYSAMIAGRHISAYPYSFISSDGQQMTGVVASAKYIDIFT